MNRPLAVVGLILALTFPAFALPAARAAGSHHSSDSSSKPKVYVKGYYRKDGTYVAPHYRAAPGGGQSNGEAKPAAAAAPRPSSGSTTPARPATTGPASSHPHGCATCPRDAHGRILRSPEARARFMRQTGYPHGRPGYVVDHIIPLECGGADTPANMQWQTIAEAKAKDRTERNCRQSSG